MNLPTKKEKAQAQAKLREQVKLGKIIRPNKCELCGVSLKSKLDAHHEDYSKPLDVIWLCRMCHVTVHKDKDLIVKNDVHQIRCSLEEIALWRQAAVSRNMTLAQWTRYILNLEAKTLLDVLALDQGRKKS